MKKNNKKGFTLAELLIVVAIIGVLTAIAIPVFTNSLENSRKAADEANTRSAYAQASADYLEDGTLDTTSITMGGITFTASVNSDGSGITVKASSGLQSNAYSSGITFTGNSGFTVGAGT